MRYSDSKIFRFDFYRGDFHARRFTCRDQFLVMSYAQLTSSASLRSIEAQLTAYYCFEDVSCRIKSLHIL